MTELKWKLHLVRLEILLILTQDICMELHRTYDRLGCRFGRTRWNSYVMWVMWNLLFIHLELVLVSVQDRCMVCAKRIISSEIVLDALDGTPR